MDSPTHVRDELLEIFKEEKRRGEHQIRVREIELEKLAREIHLRETNLMEISSINTSLLRNLHALKLNLESLSIRIQEMSRTQLNTALLINKLHAVDEQNHVLKSQLSHCISSIAHN